MQAVDLILYYTNTTSINWAVPFVFRKFKRWFLILLAAGVVGVLITSLILFLAVDTKKINSFIVKNVAAQTGGKLTISNTTFNAFTGLTVNDVTFIPPNTDGTPATDNGKFIKIKSLLFKYQLWSILYGTLDVEAIMLDGAEIRLSKKGTKWNFDGINAYRDRNSLNTPSV